MRADRDWAMLVVLCVAALLGGVLEVLFVPLYVGSVLVPVVVAARGGRQCACCRVLGRTLVATEAGALAPLLCWIDPGPGPEPDRAARGRRARPGGGGQQ